VSLRKNAPQPLRDLEREGVACNERQKRGTDP
jgi:hypothetical protein